jgi:hypothetical protein
MDHLLILDRIVTVLAPVPEGQNTVLAPVTEGLDALRQRMQQLALKCEDIHQWKMYFSMLKMYLFRINANATTKPNLTEHDLGVTLEWNNVLRISLMFIPLSDVDAPTLNNPGFNVRLTQNGLDSRGFGEHDPAARSTVNITVINRSIYDRYIEGRTAADHDSMFQLEAGVNNTSFTSFEVKNDNALRLADREIPFLVSLVPT